MCKKMKTSMHVKPFVTFLVGVIVVAVVIVIA